MLHVYITLNGMVSLTVCMICCTMPLSVNRSWHNMYIQSNASERKCSHLCCLSMQLGILDTTSLYFKLVWWFGYRCLKVVYVLFQNCQLCLFCFKDKRGLTFVHGINSVKSRAWLSIYMDENTPCWPGRHHQLLVHLMFLSIHFNTYFCIQSTNSSRYHCL